jgi:cytochrome c oxidase subunit 3
VSDAVADVIHISRGPKSAMNATLGMAIFLFSWGITFVALLFAFFWVRARSEANWPGPGLPILPKTLPTVNTAVALLSSVACHAVLVSVRNARRGAQRIAVVATLGLGLTFLALQTVSWVSLWHAGLHLYRPLEHDPWDTRVVYAGVFYALTWFHAAHVVCGLGILGWMTPGVLRGRYSPRELQPVRLATWFWHFVTVAWVGVFLSLYVL